MAFNNSMKLIFVTVSQNTGARIFEGDKAENCINLQAGSATYHTIVDKGFYLVSQKGSQKVSSPSYYKIVHSDLEVTEELMTKVMWLVYKTSYLYYNIAGSVRVPASLKYAMKLALMIDDRTTAKEESIKLDDKLIKMNSIFYL